MRTVPVSNPNKGQSLTINQLWLLSLGLFVMTLAVSSIYLARAPIMPRLAKLQPPSLKLAGTVFTQLQQADEIIWTKDGFELLFQDALLNPLSIQFSTLELSDTHSLLNENNQLTVTLLDNGQAYQSFSAYAGELSFNDTHLSINALLKNQGHQTLMLNGKLELASLDNSVLNSNP